MFESTIALGTIIHLLGTLGGVFAAVGYLIKRLARIEYSNEIQSQRISELQKEVKKISDVLIILGKYEERLLFLQRQIDELRHGKGFVA